MDRVSARHEWVTAFSRATPIGRKLNPFAFSFRPIGVARAHYPKVPRVPLTLRPGQIQTSPPPGVQDRRTIELQAERLKSGPTTEGMGYFVWRSQVETELTFTSTVVGNVNGIAVSTTNS